MQTLPPKSISPVRSYIITPSPVCLIYVLTLGGRTCISPVPHMFHASESRTLQVLLVSQRWYFTVAAFDAEMSGPSSRRRCRAVAPWFAREMSCVRGDATSSYGKAERNGTRAGRCGLNTYPSLSPCQDHPTAWTSKCAQYKGPISHNREYRQYGVDCSGHFGILEVQVPQQDLKNHQRRARRSLIEVHWVA